MTEFNENLYYFTRNSRVSISTMTFPGGEVGVNINGPELDQNADYIKLVAKIQNSNQLMAMFMATDALRRVYPFAQICLFIPYFPYARQDRVCNAGEALSVKVVAQLINSQNYATVTVVDPHSPVLVAALDRCHVIEQKTIFSHVKPSFGDTIIVAPDAGAIKKAEDFCKRVGAAGVVYANKQRNLKTGEITHLELITEHALYQRNLFVLDDICDGGRTFIELGKLLKHEEPAKMELAVSHGIFSKGVEVLTEYYDCIYTSNSLPQTEHPQLHVVKL